MNDKSRIIYFLTKECSSNLYIFKYILLVKNIIDYISSIVFKNDIALFRGHRDKLCPKFTYNKRYLKNKWSDPNKSFFSNDRNFISDPMIAKYLRSILRFPEHYINELPY